MKEINIANSELPIMKVLWKKGEQTSSEIYEDIKGNKSTFKTLLKRLVAKEMVGINEINTRTYSYYPLVTEKEYIAYERKGFLKRVFNGSKNKMLLNFIKEENITKKDLEDLMDMIEFE